MSLWGAFYSKALSKINQHMSEKAYGVYYDFTEKGCTAMVACESEKNVMQLDEILRFTVPAGKYAKFCIKGDVYQVVPLFWENIKNVKIERSYQCDFEVYPDKRTEDVDIEIYLSVK